MKQSAEDNFEFDVNSRKFSNLVENTVGKGEIARYEQFLLFPQCLQKACFPGATKGVIVWEWVKFYYACFFQSVVDGDLCEMFNSMDVAKQKSVAEELDRTPAEVSKKLEDIRTRYAF